MDFNIKEILEATKATVIKDESLKGQTFAFSTDTRTIKEGEIYLPLKGENFDGESFTDKALESGAFGFFTEQEQVNDEFLNASKLVLHVENTLLAYLRLARFYRRKINPKTVAITGSSGKTTTKEMAYCVAAQKFRTHKSELNFNNEIGLCKTILAMPKDTQVLILEMGMRGLGEIELLSKYSEPDVTIISNVGTAHIGRLGSRENIASAKCEITKFQKPEGTLISHRDHIIEKTLGFKGEKIFFALEDVVFKEKKVGYSKFCYKKHDYELNIEGDYNVQNALAVIEMGLKLKMSPFDINEGLKKYLPIEKRWEVEVIKGFNVINDSYNANPESVKASLKTFIELYNPPMAIIIGDMAELGEKELEYHKQVGEFLAEELKNSKKNVKTLTIGLLAKEIASIVQDKGFFAESFTNNSQITRYILDNLDIGTTIVLKASRAMKLEEIINQIKGES